MSLLEFQRRMAEDVQRPLTEEFAMQPVAVDGALMSERAAEYVRPNRLLTSFDRLEIYNRQYWLRVTGAVSEDYPALHAVLGDERFDAMVLAYLREHPSTSWTLRDLSGRLPRWLANHSEFTGRRHTLAVDVARLEWAYVEAFDGAHRIPLTAETLLHATGETRMALQPYVQLLKLRYPVDDLVLEVRRGVPEKEQVSGAAVRSSSHTGASLPSMRQAEVYLAVHRFQDVVYYRRIDREAYRMLDALRQGKPLAEAITAAFRGSRIQQEQRLQKIQEYFAHAAEMGWLCPSE